MSDNEEHLQALRQELRRGVLVLAVLGQLHTPQYGYSLIQQLSAHGLDVEEGTLYPLLRRLEKQGLLASEWDERDARARKYYRISDAGRMVWSSLAADWRDTVTVMQSLMQGDTKNESC